MSMQDDEQIKALHRDCVKAAKWLNRIAQETVFPVSFTQDDLLDIQDFVDEYAYDQDEV